MPISTILALETSCDETAAAVCTEKGSILSSVVASQISIHRPFGGVVPELASRNHLTALRPVVDKALEDADTLPTDLKAVAATAGPGLASSLLVGNTAAKGMALALDIPFLAINHLEGHLLSPFIGGEEIPAHVGLVVSGGHTLLIDVEADGHYKSLGTTRDDAAGEAFDKVGKMLGLPYPGGPEVERAARGGNPKAFDFPRSMMGREDLDFSFSGLKTAVLYTLQKLDPTERETWLPDLCASFQAAVIDVLIKKATRAAQQVGRDHLALSGGVSCNGSLRAAMESHCEEAGFELTLADNDLTTDNAAMIVFAAAKQLARTPAGHPLATDVDPNLGIVEVL